MATESTDRLLYNGRSELVAAFLAIHQRLTRVIHAICIAKGPEAFQNHAAEALECLIGPNAGELAPLDHLLTLRIQTYIELFGPMTFVKAVATEYGLDYVVGEYAGWRAAGSASTNYPSAATTGAPNESELLIPNSLIR